MAKISNPNVVSSIDDFLKHEGVFEEVTAQSIKRVLSWQLQEAMTAKGMTKRNRIFDGYQPQSVGPYP